MEGTAVKIADRRQHSQISRGAESRLSRVLETGFRRVHAYLQEVRGTVNQGRCAPELLTPWLARAQTSLHTDYASASVAVIVLEVLQSVLRHSPRQCSVHHVAVCEREMEGVVAKPSAAPSTGPRRSVPHPPEDFPCTIGFSGAPSAVTRSLECRFTRACLVFAAEFT